MYISRPLLPPFLLLHQPVWSPISPLQLHLQSTHHVLLRRLSLQRRHAHCRLRSLPTSPSPTNSGGLPPSAAPSSTGDDHGCAHILRSRPVHRDPLRAGSARVRCIGTAHRGRPPARPAHSQSADVPASRVRRCTSLLPARDTHSYHFECEEQE